MDKEVKYDHLSEDEQLLASLGYKQELKRTWNSFSNFAISFSIISILSGCFTTFGQAWNNGGPVAISIGWPVISIFILLIGLSLAEMTSAYPTSGGIYYWASKLGGVKAGFFTGWLNLIGTIAITSSVVYGAATFLNILVSVLSPEFSSRFFMGEAIYQQFFWFAIIMAMVTLFNTFSSHIQAWLSDISVFWHIIGVLLIVAILLITPSEHQDLKWIFTNKVNNSGFSGKGVYWFYVLPLGFLLTQFTITGYDASAHMSEETQYASNAAAKGIWKSIFYSAMGGYVLLLCLLSVATKPDIVNSFDTAVNPYGAGSVITILIHSLTPAMFKLVLMISVAGQLFSSSACLTDCSRMFYAFSRDGAIPGYKTWSKLNRHHVPVNAVMITALIGIIMTLPALWKSPRGIPTAFFAVVSIGVIGLYLAFLIPIWYRWKAGISFKQGTWNLGKHYKWINLLAMIEIVVVCTYFILPFEPAAVPGNKEFTWVAFNYAPLLVGTTLVILWIWWELSVKKWYNGPVRTIGS